MSTRSRPRCVDKLVCGAKGGSMTNRRLATRVVGNSARGFTLIEVMIVIAIVVALGTLVGIAAMSRRSEANQGIASTQLSTIRNAMKLFYVDFDRYPTDEEGLRVLWDKTALSGDEADQKKWKGYLDEPMPNDVWGRAWGYRQKSTQGDESKYDVWSNGPDGQEGTEDDVTSWPKEGSDSGSGAAPSGSGTSGR